MGSIAGNVIQCLIDMDEGIVSYATYLRSKSHCRNVYYKIDIVIRTCFCKLKQLSHVSSFYRNESFLFSELEGKIMVVLVC